MSVVMICMVVLMASIYFVMDTVEASRNEVTRMTNREGKLRIVAEMQALIRSPFIVNYSLANYNSAAQNSLLKACVLAGEPQMSNVCDNINVDFYKPVDATGVKFAGGTGHPVYFDPHGEDCLDTDGQPTDRCRFKVISQCKFTCPGGQPTCALVKTMSCDLEISPHGMGSGYVFKAFKNSEVTTLPTATYAIRLNNDLLSMYVLK